MKQIYFTVLSLLFALSSMAQKMTIHTLSNTAVSVDIITDSAKKKLLHDFKGKQDNSIRKQFTSRTYRLSDQRILVEFYDGQAVIIQDKDDLDTLQQVKFVKNYIYFLKKNISYTIEVPFEKAIELSRSGKPVISLKPSDSRTFDFRVFEIPSGQILFICLSEKNKYARLYENIKGLCSDNTEILNQYYQGMDAWAKKLVAGDPLLDFDVNGHLVYPKDIPELIRNHQLTPVESKVYVTDFYGNLYHSGKGYYILIDEVNQENGAGHTMPILSVRIYETLKDLRNAQAGYEQHKHEGVRSEHFFQKISDTYGKDFPLHARALVDSLPVVLNFDKEQLAFDDAGMAVVEEAIRWNHADYSLFDRWFPPVLAYYGACVLAEQKDGKWIVQKTKDSNIWVPQLLLSGKTFAFDVYDFYKSLAEWPSPLKEVGDWDWWRRKLAAP